jgi:hypothetical protein
MHGPYFLSAGREAADGQVLWSQPEVALYDHVHVGTSTGGYPDFVNGGGADVLRDAAIRCCAHTSPARCYLNPPTSPLNQPAAAAAAAGNATQTTFAPAAAAALCCLIHGAAFVSGITNVSAFVIARMTKEGATNRITQRQCRSLCNRSEVEPRLH